MRLSARLRLTPFVTGYSYSARLRSEGTVPHIELMAEGESPSHLGDPLSITNPPEFRTRLLSRACKMLLSACAVPRGPVASYLKLNKILGLRQGKGPSRFGMTNLCFNCQTIFFCFIKAIIFKTYSCSKNLIL